MAFSKYVITTAGRNLLLSCMESGNFRIHSLVLGSGRYTGLLSEIQDVVTPEAEFLENAIAVDYRDGQLEATARLTNEQLEQGFAWREYGVYATDGTQTVLFCYDNAGDEPVPITSAATGAGISSTIKVILTIDQAAMVNVNFQPAPDFVVDDTVTADGGNAVTGAAVYAFVQSHVPDTLPADSITAGSFAGMVKASADAAAELGAAQVRNIVMTATDPGAGATVDYPDGTVIHVYE